MATVDAHVGRLALEANRTQLVANNMLEKGHDQPTAEAEIDLLLGLVGYFNSANFSLDVTDQQLQLSLQIDVQTDD